MDNKKNSLLADIYDWLETVVIAVSVVAVVFSFVFRIVNVDGDSMNNTLVDSDKLLISDVFYEPEVGDIVIISRSGAYDVQQDKDPLIKRVIATEGQTVDINFETGNVYVDGNLLQENYIKEPTFLKADVDFPVTVTENCVFVLGDNRNDSKDSRFSEIGMVPTDRIIGKALVRVYPFSEIDFYI